jgi:hypothetical protein
MEGVQREHRLSSQDPHALEEKEGDLELERP